MTSILIPVHNSDEVVEVQIMELPDDENEIVEILMAELAPLDLWLRFAVEYYRQGRYLSFTKMLDPIIEMYEQPADRPGFSSQLFEVFGADKPHDFFEKQVKKPLLAILNSLAAFHTILGSRERDKTKKKAEFEKARRFYDSAEGVDLLMGSASVGRAALELAKGELARAQKTMEAVDAFHRASIPVLLGKACAKFNNGYFVEALKLYRKVFEVSAGKIATPFTVSQQAALL